MKIAHIHFFGAFLFCGCGLKLPDPCADGSPLFGGLTFAQQEACIECGKTVCEDDETGGDDNPSWSCVYHDFEGDLVSPTYDICVGGGNPYHDYMVNEWTVLGKEPFTKTECDAALVYPGYMGLNPGGVDFYICNHPGSAYESVGAGIALWRRVTWQHSLPGEWKDADMKSLSWGDGVRCGLNGFRCDGYITECYCACDVDADCTAISASAFDTLNEYACVGGECLATEWTPSGPLVYGLDSWSDGVRVDGDIVYVTTRFYLSAVLVGGAIFEDDQAFEVLDDGSADGTADVEITHCGPGALCDLVGLSSGDILTAPGSIGDEIEASGRSMIEVRSPRGAVRSVEIRVSQ